MILPYCRRLVSIPQRKATNALKAKAKVEDLKAEKQWPVTGLRKTVLLVAACLPLQVS